MMENTAEIQDILDHLYLVRTGLTAWQETFIRSCRNQFRKEGNLSEKQVKILRDIKKYFVSETRYSMNR
jgi:hypothetical protein